MSAPIEINDNNIKLKSAFQKNMVIMDLNKTAFKKLTINKSDFLLIDLIDERFSLIKYKSSFCTGSNEFNEGMPKLFKIFGAEHKLIKNGELYIGNIKADNMIDKFCVNIQQIYNPKHIILHKAKMTNLYIALDGHIKKFSKNYLKNNEKLNAILDYMYSRIEKNLPGINVIDEMEGTVASEKHKWGLAPMHYEEDYYYRVLTKILKIIK